MPLPPAGKMESRRTQDRGRDRGRTQPCSWPAPHDGARPGRGASLGDAARAALRPRPSSSPSGRPPNELAHYLAEDHIGTGRRRRSRSPPSRSPGPGSTTRGSRPPMTPTTGSAACATMVQMVGVVDPGARAAGDVRVARPRRDARHRRDGRRLRRHARSGWCRSGSRAAQQDVARRRTALTYIQTIVLAQVGLDGARVRRAPDRDDVRDHGRRSPDRGRGTLHRRAEQGPGHAVARAPHRRALRAARDHHPGRGGDRDGRRAHRRGPRPRGRLERRRRAAPRRRASASPSGSGGRTSRSRSARSLAARRERGFALGLRPSADLRCARRGGRRAARRRLLPRTPHRSSARSKRCSAP